MITFPLVSVVLCTYNGEKYLEEQLQSILAQTYPSIEITICDDCSVDLTQSIIKAYAFKDRRIQYFFNKENIGVNKNFEQGFSKAAGDFIAIADQDDIWKPEKVQKQMALFSSDEIVLSHTASAIFSGDKLPENKLLNKSVHLMEGNDFRKLLLRNSISGHNIIFRKRLFNQAVPFPSFVYYDWWLCQVSTCCGNIAASPEVLAFQRKHHNNVTIKNKSTSKQTKEIFEERKIALQAFLTISCLGKRDEVFSKKLLGYYQLLEHQNFSMQLFFFLLKNSSIMFFYKKKLFPYISYIKAAYQMSKISN